MEIERCNRMARHPWDIEENILVEKHLGYEYQPLDSRDWNAMQGFHDLMPMAHLLHILVLHQTALWPMAFFLTIRGTMIKLVEAVRDSGGGESSNRSPRRAPTQASVGVVARGPRNRESSESKA